MVTWSKKKKNNFLVEQIFCLDKKVNKAQARYKKVELYDNNHACFYEQEQRPSSSILT